MISGNPNFQIRLSEAFYSSGQWYGFKVIPYTAAPDITEILVPVWTINFILVAPNFVLISNSGELRRTKIVGLTSFSNHFQVKSWVIFLDRAFLATYTLAYTFLPCKQNKCALFKFFFVRWFLQYGLTSIGSGLLRLHFFLQFGYYFYFPLAVRRRMPYRYPVTALVQVGWDSNLFARELLETLLIEEPEKTYNTLTNFNPFSYG